MKAGWVVHHWTDDYRVLVDPPRRFSDDERRSTAEALFALLSDYENGEPNVTAAIERIHLALFSMDAVRSAPVSRSSIGNRGERQRVRTDLEHAARAGRLLLTSAARPTVRVPRAVAGGEVGRVIGPAEEKKTFFEARFVDEIGEAISGLEVILTVDGKQNHLKTDGSGKLRLDGVEASRGSLRVASAKALGDIVEPRWTKPRPGAMPQAPLMSQLALSEDLPSIELESELEHVIVVVPPLGRIFLELYDRTGRVRHQKRKYSIEGPMSFSGVTDDTGRLAHEGVLPGDYTLKLELSFFEGTKDAITHTYESPVVVLGSEGQTPQQRMLGAVPTVIFARARGFLFDTNKTFLLPSAVKALEKIRDVYEQNNPSELLIVGHTDTTGDAGVNDPLSVDRAKSVKAYFEDDVDAWLKNYDGSGKQKWGPREDRLMITAMPDFPLRSADEDIVEWFQRTRSLTVDGKAGPQTRKQLITEYMALDGTSLKDDTEFHIAITTHGAGENFPLADTGIELDKQAADEHEDPLDRRAELFFFDSDFGVKPSPGGAKGPEYLAWRKAAAENHDFSVAALDREASVVEVHDALFRTNSAVANPEGEASEDGQQTVSSVGLFARVLRYADEHPRKRLFIAGHTDTTSTAEFNQKLSEERARSALAQLEGDRAAFVAIAKDRHTVGDYKSILRFITAAFADLDPGKGGFNCDPGAIDDVAATGVQPVKSFQQQYNANKAAIGATGADLAVDGDVGPLTWGALFDALEFALQRELGEDAEAVKELRKKLAYADPDRKALGFSEHHPVDKVGRDNVRSQENRRVEFLFFDEGDEPDLMLAESDPDVSEIYLRGSYRHKTIESTTAKRVAMQLKLESEDGDALPGIEFAAVMDDGSERKGKLNDRGAGTIKAIASARFEVEYLDHDKIRATALAARLAKALDAKKPETVLGVLVRSTKEFEAVRAVIDEFFPRTGNLIDEIRAVASGSELADAVDYYLTGLGLGTTAPNDVIAFQDPTKGREADAAKGGFALA